MKSNTEKIMWDHHTNNPVRNSSPTQTRPLPKILLYLILFVSVTYLVYTLKLVSTSRACENNIDDDDDVTIRNSFSLSKSPPSIPPPRNRTARIAPVRSKLTELNDVVFGIAASAKLWEKRKHYIKIWYNATQGMRGVIWLDRPIKTRKIDFDEAEISLPKIRISADTSEFPYKNKQGHRSAIRISRIVSETFRLGLRNVRWFVMGDDDTVFVTENLIRILNKYDHNQYWYIGGSSESHLQNIYFSYGMAYGGGGFAISYPLARALEKMQDRCIVRYPGLYGSDDRMQACMAELGVPLTKEAGFHQYDVYGNLFGLLAAHPVTPLVSLHHLDVVEPIFPNTTRVQALKRLMNPTRLDSAGVMQQSICYDKTRSWTISVSWGFAVQIFRGVFSPREIEMPSRTFLNWYRRADYTAYAFNTRPVCRNPCQKPFIFYQSKASVNRLTNGTVTEYVRHSAPHPPCKWKMADPTVFDRVEVYKKLDPHLWDRSPRRNCCRIKDSKKKGTLVLDVGVCNEDEVSEI